MTVPKPLAGRSLKVAAAAVIAAAASGCIPRNDFTGSIPQDYRQRHAIGLMQANHTLEVFVGNNGGSLDRRQTEDVRGFARDYMQNGQGPLVAYLPSGVHGGAVGQGLDNIRRALAGGGASGRLQIAHYPADSGAAPIKLVFAKLRADTTTTCGYQDEDIIPARGWVWARTARTTILAAPIRRTWLPSWLIRGISSGRVRKARSTSTGASPASSVCARPRRTRLRRRPPPSAS